MDFLKGQGRFVAFVGAGASRLAPSRVPTWTEFNNLLLECLCERLSEYSRKRQPTDEILSTLRARRDGGGFFPPDFQAQLIEEEVGADYFRVWKSIETSVTGPVHNALAELASRGRLAAIITLNFDRLIETALEARGVRYSVFKDVAAFASLLEQLEARKEDGLAVIKIHGSIEDTASLVDTLRQRMAGRPEPLMKVLGHLLVEWPWLYLGFSGADFSYDPHYLGILDAAAEAKGFVFLARETGKIQEGVLGLAEAYGAAKSAIVRGELAPWLAETFGLDTAQEEQEVDDGDGAAMQVVRERIRAWAEDLGPLAVVNIIYAMLKGANMESQALWLMRKTWKSYRRPEDTEGKSYQRYNFNYGVSLLEAGLIRNPVALAEDMSNLSEWKELADRNAFEYLARRFSSDRLPAAGATLAAVMAYRGEMDRAIALAAEVTDEALAGEDKLALCDVALACVPIYDMTRLIEPVLPQLRGCRDKARELGDEPRRAMLNAHLGRFLSYAGLFEEADEALREAEGIARRLDLQPALQAAKAARGRWWFESGRSDETAMETLREVVEAIHARDEIPLYTKFDPLHPESEPVVVKGRSPALCRVLLDLNRAARFAGDAEVMNRTLDELDVLATEVFPGYCPHYYLAYAECLIAYGEDEEQALAADLIRRARLVGEESRNPWVGQAAERLEGQVRRAP